MQRRSIIILVFTVLTALLVGSAVPGYAWHTFRRHHVFIAPRLVVPIPLGVPYWTPYLAPPVVVAPPPVYVEQPPPPQSPPPPQYWYYCEDPKGYYPYVQQCPGGWMQVVPSTIPPA
ncbi:MAG: hypothetical protein HYZ81_20570 [Nitrospinae bacterium]|nr:hypothetical protein [Nitrospinota bacterium]